MVDSIVNSMVGFFQDSIPKELVVFIISLFPILELRGGMISAKEIKKVYRHEIDCEEYTKKFGKALGKLALALNDSEEITPVINVKSKQIKIPAENFVLILARLLKVLNNDFLKNFQNASYKISAKIHI